MRLLRSAGLALIALSMAMAACSRNKKETPSVFSDELTAPVQSGAPLEGAGGAGMSEQLGEDAMRPTGPGVSASSVLRTVYFDYDRADLRSDQRPVLDGNYDYLVAHPDLRVIIEGNCDERGTVEYNFALGDRRASEVKKYLTTRGIDPQRLITISKGEEEPVALGHNEDAWRQNRRCEFKFMQ